MAIPDTTGDLPDISRLDQLRALKGLAAVGLLVLLLAVAVAGRYLISSFRKIETADAAHKATQLYQGVDADLRQLAIGDRDYAEWDDAARFVATRDTEFVAANFTRETLGGLHVDLVWVVGPRGEELYSGYVDRRSGQLESPAPRNLLHDLRRFGVPDRALSERPAIERTTETALGLTAVSAMEITRTDGTGPTGALMVFARALGPAEIARVHDTTQLDFTITDISATADTSATSGAPGAAAAALPPAVLSWARAEGKSNLFSLPRDSRLIDAYALLRDVDRRPVAVLTTTFTRDAYLLGLHAIWAMLGGVTILLLAFAVALLRLVGRLQRSLSAFEGAQTRLRRISGQVQELIVIADARTFRIVDVNDAMLKKLGTAHAPVTGLTLSDLFPNLDPANPESTPPADDETGTRRRITDLVNRRLTTLTPSGGVAIPVEANLTRFTEEGRELLCVVSSDVSHRQQAELQQRENERKLAHLARHDPLTGLPNRLYLHAKLPRLLRTAAIRGHLVAVMYLDVDNFKNINDTSGHSAGDRLLQVLAGRLRAAVHEQDIVARIGGDEFVIVAPQLNDGETAENLARRLQSAVQGPIVIDVDAVEVSASIGIALYPDHGLDVETILKHSDIALYQAKAAGKRCHKMFSAEMNLLAGEQLALEQALRRAIGTDQIYLDYQPIMDLGTGLVASLEALVRWRHPELGLIPPAQFIPAAEKSDLILDLGQCILRTVIADLREWLDAGVPVVPIAVNVSPCQLERTDFPAVLAQLAEEKNIERQWLNFEITESVLLKEPDRIVHSLRKIREAGSKILIDDFGVGYSSLNYLNRLPIDVLKIDQSFVRDIAIDSTRLPIVRAIIEMAHNLGLSTVAEGIEAADQLVILTELGCDKAQGYFLSRPLAAKHCRAMLTQMRGSRSLTETVMARALASS